LGGGFSEAILVLPWTAWRRWISARRRDTVRVFFDGFNVVCVGINVITKIDLFSFYWILCWSEINWNSGYGNVLGILVHELNWVIQESKDR